MDGIKIINDIQTYHNNYGFQEDKRTLNNSHTQPHGLLP